MIAQLRGGLLEKHPNQLVVDVAGVGYDVTIPMSTFQPWATSGRRCTLRVHTHVREDAIALFGFVSAEEKKIFEKLISVSGIGPKLAITVLSGLADRGPGPTIRKDNWNGSSESQGSARKPASA